MQWREQTERVKSYMEKDGFETDKGSKAWRIFCLVLQIIVGATFVFSGLMKGIDPFGTALKINEYANVIGISLPEWLAMTFSVGLNVFEALLGFALVLGLVPRLTGMLSLIFISFMTLVTLFIYIYNPVADCGCFGDAVILSNSATFWKNIVLLVLVLALWLKRSRWVRMLDDNWDTALLIITTILLIHFNIYPIKYLPVIDFRPYKIGSDLMELTHTGGNEGVYEYYFVYEKDGVEKTYGIDQIAELDSTWTFVRDEIITIQEAVRPAGADFVLVREDGSNAIESLAYPEGKALLLISPDLTRVKPRMLERVLTWQERTGHPVSLLIGNAGNIWDNPKYAPYQDEFAEVLSLDKSTAETVIRSNPGLVSIEGGMIKNKLSGKELLKRIDDQNFKDNPYQLPSNWKIVKRWISSFGVLALYLIVLMLLGLLHHLHLKKLRGKWEEKE